MKYLGVKSRIITNVLRVVREICMLILWLIICMLYCSSESCQKRDFVILQLCQFKHGVTFFVKESISRQVKMSVGRQGFVACQTALPIIMKGALAKGVYKCLLAAQLCHTRCLWCQKLKSAIISRRIRLLAKTEPTEVMHE